MQIRKTTLVRRKEIIVAVSELIVKSGSEHVTIKNIAHIIGTSEGAIYRHFASKKEILSFLVDDIEETLLGDLKNINIAQIKSLDSLTETVMKHVSMIGKRKGITFLVIAEIVSYGDAKLNNKIYSVINRYLESIEMLFSEVAENGLINKEIDFKAVAQLFFGMTQGLVNIWALSKYNFNLEEEFMPLWTILIKSIAK